MMDYSITRTSPDELEHFGTKGMRWGERRYQNEDGSLTALGRERYGVGGQRGALGTKHDLNKLDREQTQAKVRYDYYNKKYIRRSAKVNKKLQKAKAKGDADSIVKLKAKKAEIESGVGQKAKDYKSLLDRSQKMTDKIIAATKTKGWSIHSRDTLRMVNKGQTAIADAVFLTAAMAIYKSSDAKKAEGSKLPIPMKRQYSGVTPQYATGKHYRVRRDGLGTETHRSNRFGIELGAKR